MDQRGYGESDKPSGKANYAIEKLAGDIKQLIPALGIHLFYLEQKGFHPVTNFKIKCQLKSEWSHKCI